MKPIDIIALILTSSVCLFFMSAVLGPWVTGTPLSTEKAEMVTGLLSACIAIISMYVGSRLKGRDKE